MSALILTEVHRVVELKVMAGCMAGAEWEARRQGVPERVRPKIRRLGQPGIAPEVWRWEWFEPTVEVVKADPAART